MLFAPSCGCRRLGRRLGRGARIAQQSGSRRARRRSRRAGPECEGPIIGRTAVADLPARSFTQAMATGDGVTPISLATSTTASTTAARWPASSADSEASCSRLRQGAQPSRGCRRDLALPAASRGVQAATRCSLCDPADLSKARTGDVRDTWGTKIIPLCAASACLEAGSSVAVASARSCRVVRRAAASGSKLR
jgi:hypothetical protein